MSTVVPVVLRASRVAVGLDHIGQGVALVDRNFHFAGLHHVNQIVGGFLHLGFGADKVSKVGRVT